ncbi:MAG: S1C family serine protease [Fidelibacterota bacterium]
MKRLLIILLGLLFTTSLLAEEKEDRVDKYTLSTDDDHLKIVCEVEDGICHIVLNKDGDTEEFEFSIDDLDDLGTSLQEILEKTDIDLNLNITDLDDLDDFTGKRKHHMAMMKHHRGSWLGVYLQPLTEQLRDYFRVKDDSGVLVSEVVEDSPAEKAGIEAGDVIIAVGENKISNQDDVVKSIFAREEGDEVEITIIRKGRQKTLTATLSSREVNFPEKLFMFKPGREEHNGEMMKWLPSFGERHDDMKEEIAKLREDLEELRNELEKMKDK